MKKEYVKPQNQVVFLKDSLLQAPIGVSGNKDTETKMNILDDDFDSNDSPKNLWDD